MDSYTLVTSMQQVRENIIRFNKDLNEAENADLAGQLSQFKQWYFDPASRLFGPSKFIGYAHMTAGRWRNKKGYHLNGGSTENALAEWRARPESGSPEATRLAEDLAAFLARYDRAPKSSAEISVLRG
jgi:hypothetical protein